MKKKKLLLLFLLFVVILFTVRKVNELYLQKQYPLISDLNSENYKIVKVDIPGPFEEIKYQNASYGFSKDPKHISSLIRSGSGSGGYVSLDVKTLKFIVELNTRGQQNVAYIIINPKGEVIKKIKDTEVENYIVRDTNKWKTIVDFTLLKHSLLLINKLKPSLNNEVEKHALHLSDFINKYDFNSRCYDPLRDYGNPTGGRPCYVWKGNGCFDLTFNDETLKFRLPWKLQTYFFLGNNLSITPLKSAYYIPPKEYQDALGNMAIILMDNALYFILEK